MDKLKSGATFYLAALSSSLSKVIQLGTSQIGSDLADGYKGLTESHFSDLWNEDNKIP